MNFSKALPFHSRPFCYGVCYEKIGRDATCALTAFVVKCCTTVRGVAQW